jgi:hypothetical protein
MSDSGMDFFLEYFAMAKGVKNVNLRLNCVTHAPTKDLTFDK